MPTEIKVLDHGYVHLIETMGSDERIIESARMSTARGFEGWEKDAKLLRFLFTHGHMTPFEMCEMTIEVKAPIFVFREWHRHRTQSYNEMSARYIPLPDENYVPNLQVLLQRSADGAAAANKQAQGTRALTEEQALIDLDDLEDAYEKMEHLYRGFLSRGWPKELARLVIPVARYSQMRAKANLRNWLGFMTLRCAPNAQWEIRQYADAVAAIIQEKFPRTYALWEEGFDRAS